MFAERHPQTNDRIDERRQLHAAESALAGALLLTVGDLHGDVGLGPIVDDTQPFFAAQGIAQLADGGEPPLQCVAGRRTAGDFGGKDVDADRFLPVRPGLTATEKAAQHKRDNNSHFEIIAPLIVLALLRGLTEPAGTFRASDIALESMHI